MTEFSSAILDQAQLTTDAAPSAHAKAASDGRTGIEYRSRGELGGPRSQPYTVWYQGEIVYFCRTKGEAVNALRRAPQ